MVVHTSKQVCILIWREVVILLIKSERPLLHPGLQFLMKDIQQSNTTHLELARRHSHAFGKFRLTNKNGETVNYFSCIQVFCSKQRFLGSLPVDSHSLAIHQGLGSAPAKSDKLRVTEHWVQVLEEPRFSLGV